MSIPAQIQVDALLDRLQELYRTVDTEMALLGFVCRQDAACCTEYPLGPTPYPLEVLYLKRYLQQRGILAPGRTATTAPCPFLETTSCSIYPARPFNCRAFTCDGSALDLYAAWKSRVTALCDEFSSLSGSPCTRIPLRQYFP